MLGHSRSAHDLGALKISRGKMLAAIGKSIRPALNGPGPAGAHSMYSRIDDVIVSVNQYSDMSSSIRPLLRASCGSPLLSVHAWNFSRIHVAGRSRGSTCLLAS